jgi:hypothetical protein
MACLPDEKIDIAIFSNVPNVDISGASQEIIKMLLNINTENKTATQEKKPEEPPEPVSFTEDELKAYPGTYYSSEVEAFYRVYEENGRLFIQHRRYGSKEIIKTSAGNTAELAELTVALVGHGRLSIEFKKAESSDIADELCFFSGRVLDFRFKRIDLSQY